MLTPSSAKDFHGRPCTILLVHEPYDGATSTSSGNSSLFTDYLWQPWREFGAYSYQGIWYFADTVIPRTDYRHCSDCFRFFYFQNNIGPDSQKHIAQLLISMKQKSPELEIPEGIFYDGIPQTNLYVEKKDLNTGTFTTSWFTE